MTDGVFLSTTTLASLPAQVREAVMSALLVPVGQSSAHEGAEEFDAEFDALASLYPPKMREFMQGVGSKSEALLLEIAKGNADWRHLMDIAGHEKWQQLSGFLAGLTKRVRTVTGDANATFWGTRKGPTIEDDVNGTWNNDTLLLHPVTLKSLRRHFGLD